MIYVHIPFCHSKCSYCAFYSLGAPSARLQTDYVDALLLEIRQRHTVLPYPIRTVYIGGGTPSLLPLTQLERIVCALRDAFDLSHLEEATIEANPEDLTPDYLQHLRSLHFFNRLSIGIQSLDDDMLRLLKRRHTASQAIASVQEARRQGFCNISVDFIYGLPGIYRFPDFDLSIVSHISAYALTVEGHTALDLQVKRHQITLPDDDEVARQYHETCRHLAAVGFEHYEVSNFARPGFRSRHNSRYWNRTPYLGLGAAAHSFDGIHRRWNVSNLHRYIATRAFDQETLSPTDAHNELLMTALRTSDGLPSSAVDPTQMQPYIDAGWLRLAQGRYRPTDEGMLHADGIAAHLFS